MSNKIFAFDLDETLVKGKLIETASRDLYLRGCLKKLYYDTDATDYYLTRLPEILREEVFHRYTETEYAVWDKKPIEGVIYFLYYLKKHGYKNIILTSRPVQVQNDTEKYVSSVFRECISDVLFSNTKKTVRSASKTKYLRLLKPLIYFDDMPKYITESIDLGIETYLISNKRTVWNHQYHNPLAKKIKNPCYFDITSLKGKTL